MSIEPGQGVRAKAIRVVVAEDDAAVREALVDLINAERDFEVVGQATDAEEAADRAAGCKADVVLVDVKMPGGGGPKATREIVSRCAGTRVVALSAYDDQETMRQMLDAGASAYLVKGTPVAEILGTLRRAAQS